MSYFTGTQFWDPKSNTLKQNKHPIFSMEYIRSKYQLVWSKSKDLGQNRNLYGSNPNNLGQNIQSFC